ncbi:MAG: tetratricopeptide repeat protein [Deltaproteobacteria bacterium]|nr:MAG: tetratricopeptide repeat protein [Deltaproteobacteria bacterium]
MSKPRNKKSRPQRQSEPSTQLDFWIALFVAIVTLAVFFPATRNEFVAWDDYELLVNNPRYRGLGWEQLRWMFSTFYMGHYQPLSWVTFGLDYLLWGMDPFGYHLTSVLLHTANAVLFFFVALRLLSLTIPPGLRDLALKAAAASAALFFAIHPLRVESVAWVTERRDVLSGLFFLATILSYLHATTVSHASSFRRRWLCVALIFYSLSLLSKATGVTLPVVLLVLDVYPLRRLRYVPGTWWFGPSARPIWWEKVPFLVLAAAAAVIAPLAQHDAGAMASLRRHGLLPRLAQSSYGVVFYLWKTIWPTDLSGLYELPPNLNVLAWPFLLTGAVVVGITIGLFMLRHSWPAGLASWICYVIIVAPVLGIIQSGWQMVADRYSYLSCLAWAVLAGGGLYNWRERSIDPRRDGRKFFFFATGAAAVIIMTLGILTWKQVKVWHDTDLLWNHILAITDKSTFKSGNVHHLVARSMVDRGDWDRAVEHFRKSIEIEPNLAPFYSDLGNALARQGRWDEAVENFQKALALNPNLSVAHFNLGNALALQGRFGEAAAHLQDALRIKPDYTQAYNNLGRVLAAQGQLDRAIDLFRRAVQIQPDFAEAHQSLAMALEEKGRKEEAVQELQEATRIMKSRSEAQAQR